MKKKNAASPTEPTATRTLKELAQKLCAPTSYALFGALMAWAILQPLDSTEVYQGSGLPQNLGWILLAILVSLLGVLDGGFQRVRNFELSVLGVLILWMLVVTIRAGWFCNPRTGWHGFWHIVGLICFYYSARCLLANSRSGRMAISILLAGGLVLALHGLYQVAIEFPADRFNYVQNPEVVLRQAGLDAPPGSPQRLRFEARLNSPEPFATFALTNSLAVLLSGGLVIALGMAHQTLWASKEFSASVISPRGSGSRSGSRHSRLAVSKTSSRASLQRRHLAAVLVVGSLIGIVWLLTRSRVAYLSVLAAASVWAAGSALNSRQRSVRDESLQSTQPNSLAGHRWHWMGLIIGLISLAVLAWWFFDRDIWNGAVRSLSFRADYWTATLRMIADHWLWGIGMGNFQSYYPRYMLATASETIADPHNWILDLAVNGSVPWALLVAGCLLYRLVVRPGILEPELPDGATHEDFAEETGGYSMATGAILGSILAGIGLWLFGFNFPLLLVSLPIAIGLMVWVWPATQGLATGNRFWVRLAGLTMLGCLLVSGSWQASGIAIPLLCLFAFGTDASRKSNSAGGTPPGSEAKDLPLESKSPTRGIAISAALGLVFASFVVQGWNPMLLSSSVGMSQQTSLSGQLQAVQRAGQLDPLDGNWDRFLADLKTQWAVESSAAKDFEQRSDEAVREIERWASREPISFLTWQAAGQHALDLASRAQALNVPHQRFLAMATEFFQQAVEAFPASVQLHAQLALSHYLQGNLELSRQELDRAAALDAETPHLDRKLSRQIIWVPQFQGVPTSLVRTSGQWCMAEPVVNWMRTHW